jgi:hypothetical protein
MNEHSSDVLTRLAAADPGRDVVVEQAARAQLWQLIAATPGGGARAGGGDDATRTRRRPRPLRRLVLVIPVLLVLAAGALAATGVIRIGAPAEKPGGEGFSSLRGGGLLRGTVRLLAIATPDPAGGPPWGMRVFSTKQGEGCVQVGRLLDGKLGAIGQDNAFGDDGQFHAFAESSAFARHACTLLDGNNRIFLNATVGDIPASAWVGFGAGGCVPSTASHAERFGANGKPYAICPQADERNLYYGLLGPDAKSITYKLNGQAHTQATVGPEGAYLLVTRASPTQLFNFNAGGTQDVVPVDGPITELHYRDGSTCHLTARSWIGGKDACTPPLKVPVGWTPPRTPVPTAAQVAAPLHTQLLFIPKGVHSQLLQTTQGPRKVRFYSSKDHYEIVISFTSRVAIANARSVYTIKYREPGMPPGVYGGGPLTPSTPAVGQTVTARIGELGAALRPGVTSGEIVFQDAAGPGNVEEGPGTVERVVGRFSVRVP